MRRMPKAMYVWPGLPQLWKGGNWYALAVAATAAALLNLLLAVTFGWSELIAPATRTALWIGMFAGWITAIAATEMRYRRTNPAEDTDADTDRYCEAIEFYLKGDYFQAERLLSGLLRRDARDAEARLTLATLMRRTGRFDEATRQLDRLVRIEAAEKWELEIERERELLAELEKTTGCPVEGQANRDPAGPTADRKHAA